MFMKVTSAILEQCGVRRRERERYLGDLRRALAEHGVDTPLRLAHFIAQVAHESTMLRHVTENLNYSAAALRRVFPRHFTEAQARRYARDPEAIGNRAYSGRLGNGDEPSGDGYRFRGRGLIQLTGRANYRAFAAWVDADVVAEPTRVAREYAVACAVYFWTERGLNEIADRDDARAITRAINGGFNGYDDRLLLLERTKAALSIAHSPAAIPVPTHRVTASMLNIRNAPRIAVSSRIGALPEHTPVAILSEPAPRGWSLVRCDLHGRLIEGFVATAFLAPLAPRAATVTGTRLIPRPIVIPPAHLRTGNRRVTRARDGGRAHPLGEAGVPRRSGSRAPTKARQLLDIVAYLDCEQTAHRRYRATRGKTFCNIYAYDYCYLAGAYLPRVWWRGPALRQIGDGVPVEVAYGSTVLELNANALFEWFVDYGRDFGWRAEHDLDTLQGSANNGGVCVIVAKRFDPNAAGHISVVAPESRTARARRSADGTVRAPVESHAGARNRKLHVAPRRWWIADKFQAFGFWRHE